MSMANSLLAKDFVVTNAVSSATGMVLATDNLELKGLRLENLDEVLGSTPVNVKSPDSPKRKKNNNDDKNVKCHDSHISPKQSLNSLLNRQYPICCGSLHLWCVFRGTNFKAASGALQLTFEAQALSNLAWTVAKLRFHHQALLETFTEKSDWFKLRLFWREMWNSA